MKKNEKSHEIDLLCQTSFPKKDMIIRDRVKRAPTRPHATPSSPKLPQAPQSAPKRPHALQAPPSAPKCPTHVARSEDYIKVKWALKTLPKILNCACPFRKNSRSPTYWAMLYRGIVIRHGDSKKVFWTLSATGSFNYFSEIFWNMNTFQKTQLYNTAELLAQSMQKFCLVFKF